MKGRPIIFSTGSVRAIMAGRKTQTRRVIKDISVYLEKRSMHHFHVCVKNEDWYKPVEWSPFGVPGDQLWIKEAWTLGNISVGKYPTIQVIYRADGQSKIFSVSEHIANKYGEKLEFLEAAGNGNDNWQVPLFMPKFASRSILEIHKTRIELMQDISDEDIKAEGLETREEFHQHWDEINANRGYGWDVNPWVCVIEFRLLREVEG